MNSVLLVRKDGLSEVIEGFASKLSDQDVEGLPSRFKNMPIDVVLDDPAYVSASYPVEFRQRRERRILAESRFGELAGADGVGNWCIAPEGAGFRLYVLALDPGSAEVSCLEKLVAEGLLINSISSTLMSKLVNRSFGSLVLRVAVWESCVQLALQHHGTWIFARRIEGGQENAKEAIGTTLNYLQSQAYLELPFEGVWELVSDDQVAAGLAELWTGSEAILPEPDQRDPAVLDGSKPTIISKFNYIGWQQQMSLYRERKPLLLLALVFASLVFAYAIPKLIAPIEWLVIDRGRDIDVPEVVQQRFWTSNQIHQWAITAPRTVANDLTRLFAVLGEQAGVAVQDISVDSGRSYRVRCSLGAQYDDPLLKRELHLSLRDRVSAQLIKHRVSVQEFDGHSLDSRKETSVFELVLEFPRELD